MNPIIQVRNLKKYYGPGVEKGLVNDLTTKALDGIDLVINRGEYVAIMGPSGSGKSTLMQILGLLDRKTEGNFLLDGVDTSSLNDNELAELRSAKIGFIFQFFNLLPRTTSLDNVILPMIYSGKTENLKEKAKNLLEKVGLGDRLFHKSNELSGGQQQRVAIARALANNPEIIFADEPTGNISSQHQKEVLHLLDSLNQEGATIILVTHQEEVAQRAQRCIWIKDGQIFEDRELRPLKNVANQKKELEELKRKPILRLQESLKMAYTALGLNKARTFLAALGIMIGIASVVTMMGVGGGAKKAVANQLSSLGTNILYIWAINPKAKTGMRYRKFSLDDYQALTSVALKNPLFKTVDARVYGRATVSYGPKSHSTHLTGSKPSYELMQNNIPIAGRFFTKQEDQSKKRVALLGTTVLEKLYPQGSNPIGSTIKINRIDFKVIGILPSKGANSYRDRDDRIIMPIQTAMRRVLGKRLISGLIAEITSQEVMEEAIFFLKSFLRKRRKLKPHQENDFKIQNLNEVKKVYSKTTTIITSMLAAIASVSLLVGGIGIMNIMFVAVKERTREIGLRKAIGAKGSDIKAQFLIEAILIGLIGGGFGVIGGYGLSLLSEIFLGWPALISGQIILTTTLFSILIGVIFGLWPASQASKLSPIEALRYE